MRTLLNQQNRINPKVAVSVVYVAAMFISIMDTSIVNVALPSIGRDFHVTPTAVDGISIAFLVSLAVFIPASGWLGDRFGGKRVLMSAIVVFTVASALCGLAGSVGELVAFRILQGVGGGMLAPVGTAMLFRAFPPQERVRAASIIVVPTALAPALAPVIGGLLVTDDGTSPWPTSAGVAPSSCRRATRSAYGRRRSWRARCARGSSPSWVAGRQRRRCRRQQRRDRRNPRARGWSRRVPRCQHPSRAPPPRTGRAPSHPEPSYESEQVASPLAVRGAVPLKARFPIPPFK